MVYQLDMWHSGAFDWILYMYLEVECSNPTRRLNSLASLSLHIQIIWNTNNMFGNRNIEHVETFSLVRSTYLWVN